MGGDGGRELKHVHDDDEPSGSASHCGRLSYMAKLLFADADRR